jgi:hypothetical protein
MSDCREHCRAVTRRHFLGECGVGLGKIALASLLAQETARAQDRPQPPHFKGKAKAVIHLFMSGAPSHLDLFDYKPKLKELEGKPLPPSVIGTQRFAFIRSDAGVLAPRFKFARHGRTGAELSEMLPHLAKVVDDLCIVRSVRTDQFNHAPAQMFFNTGFSQPGRPSMGSWVSYGLGSESRNLRVRRDVHRCGDQRRRGALVERLPADRLHRRPVPEPGDPILNVTSPTVDARLQKETFDLIGDLNRKRLETIADPAISTRIAAYEMAQRLQTSAPELMDLKGESRETLDLYGIKDPSKASFARACLVARRMIERGVRFINIFHEGWDAHRDVAGNLKKNCGDTDQGAAALVADLKQRGMLDEVLVVWGGEFGRTPMVETNAALGRSQGRDHHPHAYTMWLAGGGIRPGLQHGVTDELGYSVVEDPVHVHDLQATILHCLGLDHERLTYRYSGRDFRLTDVHGHS